MRTNGSGKLGRVEATLLTALLPCQPAGQRAVAAACLASCGMIFVLDLFTPGEVGPEALYGIVLLGALWAGRPTFSLALAALCTVLIPLGHLLYPTPYPLWVTVADRSFALLMVWAVSGLVLALHATLTHLRDRDAALRASATFMETVVGSLGEGLVAYDPELRYTLWNAFMERLTGVPAAAALGRRATDVFPPLMEQGAGRLLAQALAGEVVQAPEMHYRDPNTGRTTWARVTYCPHRDGRGQIIGVLGLVHDLTRRKDVEEARDRYHLLAEAASDIILFVRPTDGRILEANAAAVAAYGYSRAELLGRTIADLRAPETRTAVPDDLASTTTEGMCLETRQQRQDGSCFPVEVRARATTLGGEPILLGIIRDISERQRVEQALRLSEAKFATAFGANPSAIALTRVRDGVILDVNDTALALMRYRREQVVGRSVMDLGVWVDPAERTHYVQALRDTGRVRGWEVQFADRDRRVIDVLLSAEVIAYADEPLILSTFLDITERRRADDALRESEDRLRFALETSQTGAWDLDLATHTAVRSLEHDRIFGYPSLLPAWTYARFLEHVVPEDRAAVDAAFQHAVATQGDWNFECRIRRADGAPRWIWGAGRPRLGAGAGKRLAGIVQDITARKEAEAALVAERALLAAVLEQAPDPMVALNAQGRYVLANSAARKHIGRNPVGMPVVEVMEPLGTITDGRGRPIPYERRPLLRALQGERVRGQHQVLIRPDGRRSEHLCSATPIALGPGDSDRLALGIIVDITAEKAAEAALRAALAEKEAALAANLTLLREVHHRVKNNLQMLCDMMYLQMEAMPDPERHQDLQDAYGRIYAVARLHEQLYQAMQAGRVALHEYLGRLVEGFGAVYPTVPVRVEAVEGITLDLDRAIHVGLVVNELVTNACKHAFTDGRTGEVVVRLTIQSEQLELQVSDNGRGLPPDLDLEQIKSLGLRIVSILAKRLQGTVTITNENGAAFTVLFPLHAEPLVEPR